MRHPKYGFDPNFITILENMLHLDENKRWDFVRVENEIRKIEETKKATTIDLDNSMIE